MFCKRWALGSLLALAAVGYATTASSEDGPSNSLFFDKPFLSEVRGGILYHDLTDREEGVDVNLEIMSNWGAIEFTTPLLNTQARLRPHVGATVNFFGETSLIYAGYSLTVDLNDYLFVEGSFGGGFHNGRHSKGGDPDSLALGCSATFRESASIGVRLTENLNVSAMIDHASNNGHCSSNNGLTNAGMRLGYSF